MLNNDILRRLRYAFDLNDDKMIAIFALGGLNTDRETISNWLRKEDDDGYVFIEDIETAKFLNGFIVEKRGAKDGVTPEPEKILTNNLVLRKLKIALNMKDSDILEMMEKEKFEVSKHELSALFRKKGHKHYRECKDQFLRNFLTGLQLKLRPLEA
jgi:uncharacterized protein YehS (DUF1456 family)